MRKLTQEDLTIMANLFLSVGQLQVGAMLGKPEIILNTATDIQKFTQMLLDNLLDSPIIKGNENG